MKIQCTICLGLSLVSLLTSGCPTGGLQGNKQSYANSGHTGPAGGNAPRVGPGYEEIEEPTTDSRILSMRKAARELADRREADAKGLEVQHVLISFSGTETAATRTKAEAEKLAAEVYAQAIAGEDFTGLMKRHSDDPGPGVYAMVLDPKLADNRSVFLRQGMVPAFGNVGWRLKVGEVGVAPYHAANSPFGWHIIRRLK